MHSPTPWYCGSQNDALFIIDRKPRPVPVDHITAGDPDTTVIAKIHDIDNASRIVAAVNFFHGRDIATENIPEGGFWEMVDLLKAVAHESSWFSEDAREALAKLGIEL